MQSFYGTRVRCSAKIGQLRLTLGAADRNYLAESVNRKMQGKISKFCG